MLKKISPFLPFLVLLVFAPAISGPLQLDDSIHLAPIIEWLSTRDGTYDLAFGNTSGPFGRPISIISFMLNAITTGAAIWPMKLTNLILHLITGLFLAKLLDQLFRRDANLITQAKLGSLIVANIWLILPQHFSTVFYIIQRMTILATLFTVISCWLYVLGRTKMEAREKGGLLFLSGAAVMAVLSILSKESGLLIPLYCLLLELIYFRERTENPRPKIILWGFRLGVIYPCLLVAAYLATNPDFVLAPYTDRPFSMPERAMTQISVMADYFASTFAPMMRSAGIYNDDFPIARHMSSREILILTAAAGLIIAAVLMRKKYSSFSAGIGLFFIGHLLESSIFSLEIYFPHRNYMPSIGLMLAASGLFGGILHRHPISPTVSRQLLPFAFAVLLAAYCVSSFSRAILWSDNESLLKYAEIHHPTSSRMRSEMLLISLYSGRTDLALREADIALRTAPKNEKRGVQLWRLLAYCYAREPMPDSELQALSTMSADRITLATNTALIYVSAAAEANSCPGLDRKRLGILASRWASNTVQYQGSPLVWKTRLASARLLASSGDLEAGHKQAEWAFTDSGYSFDAGVLALQLANSLENKEKVQRAMSKLLENQSRYTSLQQAQLRRLPNS